MKQAASKGAILFFVLTAFLVQESIGQNTWDAGAIRTEVDAQTRPIAIVSGDRNLAALGERAFNTHGAFRVASQNDAAYVVRVTPAGPSSVTVNLQSGGRVLLNETVSGSNLNNAALRAFDRVVTAITKQPGYFAGQLALVGERSGHREIYVGDLFFQNMRQLTQDKSISLNPKWSPDGTKIVYTSYSRSGFPDLLVIDLSSGRRSLLAGYKGTNTGGSFSPNGSQIAMILSAPGNSELYVADAQGRNPRRLTNNKHVEATPSWSPDGRTIVFTSDVMGGPQIFTIPASGGQMTRVPTNISGYCTEPVWNPRDPNKIAFTAAAGRGMQIALYDRGARQSKWLTKGAGENIEPAWLNDGRHLIYTNRQGNSKTLYILDTETGKQTPLHSSAFGSASQAAFVYPGS